ncbi:hypothetical protein [Microtetraspora sp. NBRC 16547]|uniref:TRAFAC clade GTPase domain-containing protein n=1 Tax=Microtetraspora sp. NBRC 16547 TaxID=3030993 RepID=UPI002555536F|nr:hypothetical protein [Microtetraspora sp. NBRC 16547]
MKATEDEADDHFLLPWSGGALGLADLAFVAGRARPMIIGIIGPANAGKTTLLAAWYLLLGRGEAHPTDRRFSGSFSLEGWETVAGSLRWAPGRMPSFPPHTTSRGDRAPGLLHLSFIEEGQRRSTDYLFTDAPGEWFQRWESNRDAAQAEGARWIADHADILLLIADRGALAGERRGAARGSFQRLARRLAAERRERPVALVWTKADIEVEPEMEQAVQQSVLQLMPDAAEFSVSVLEAETGWTALLDWVLQARRPGVVLPTHLAKSDDPFFLLGAVPA